MGGLAADEQAQQTDEYQQLLELQESMGGEVATGLSLAELTKLPVRRLACASESRCCICCCELVEGDQAMTLGCGHEFHLECIHTWLRAKRTCPMCKQPAAPSADGAAPPAE